MIVADKIKVTMEIDGVVVDATNDIVEWDSLEMLQERDETSGVITTNSFPVKVRGNTMLMLKAAFEADGLYSSGSVSIYERGDFDNEYTLIKSSPIDFSTYQEYDSYISIELSESELNDLINSEGKTDYDIPVSELKESKKWKYDRMELVNIGEYEIATDTEFSVYTEPINAEYVYLPMIVKNSEVVYGVEIDFKDQSINWDGLGEDSQFREYFFESKEKKRVDASIKIGNIDIEGSCRWTKVTGGESKNLELILYIYNTNDTGKNNILELKKWQFSRSYVDDGRYMICNFSLSIKELKLDFSIKEDDRLCLVWANKDELHVFEYVKFKITKFGGFSMIFKQRSPNTQQIDVIDPENLIQAYLDRMSGEKNKYSVYINWGGEANKIMIVAAESIRQLPNAQIHGSPNDFFDWMKVLGYEYQINGNSLVFMRRDIFFTKLSTAIELGEDEVSDLIIQADGTYAYTSVEIGYDKQEYDSVNGRCEANGTFTYTTGYITKDDNKLSMISPYRADSVGIELLCQETDKKTTDTDSDNDIFFVDMAENSSNYTISGTTQIQDSEIGLTMFNGRMNPYYLVKRNESLIGINAKQLKFKSTDMSRNAKIGGINPYQDMTITKQLFKPVLYNFAAGHHNDMPSTKKDGLVKFKWHGEELSGFIKSIRKNYVTEEETTWELYKA